ncbi:MAG: C-terminal element [Pseudomonadota bacterium]|mgnify:CR=1 FL=1|jgi:hypothetical protein|nr:C-terminal element [Pseudomonadota bacterium]
MSLIQSAKLNGYDPHAYLNLKTAVETGGRAETLAWRGFW